MEDNRTAGMAKLHGHSIVSTLQIVTSVATLCTTLLCLRELRTSAMTTPEKTVVQAGSGTVGVQSGTSPLRCRILSIEAYDDRTRVSLELLNRSKEACRASEFCLAGAIGTITFVDALSKRWKIIAPLLEYVPPSLEKDYCIFLYPSQPVIRTLCEDGRLVPVEPPESHDGKVQSAPPENLSYSLKTDLSVADFRLRKRRDLTMEGAGYAPVIWLGKRNTTHK